ncbi:MAG: PSD1 domain-containing protein [Bryobacterales bacterium]|nr:PSD1 domain-containing protein [Bryobacterales bacterium]
MFAILVNFLLLPLTAQSDATTESSFAKVRPVLETQCLGCHNPKLRMANLSLASRADVLAGGKRGTVVVPGKPRESRLLAAVRQEGNLRMPPSSRLADGEIAALEAWIQAGAPWPENVAAKVPGKLNHWAFVTPVRPSEPAVRQRGWVRTPVDSFVLARLEKEGIAPSAEAEATTLVRRLYLDLLGLPPTPEETAAFLDDRRPDAWPRLVEKLLASPHYGERWGRRWLDQARYADSDGGSRDEPRQIWRYRDWVIQALNADMPFDQFVVEQLAGDLLPNPTHSQLIATGFHRNSPIQIEAGTDREQYRVEAVVDRVDTTGTVLFGMSVGCARCHDHKFDPISHREYYQLFAFFNSTDDWGNDRPRYNARYNNLVHVQGPLLEFAPVDVIATRDRVLARLVELDEKLDDYKREKKPKPDDAFVKEIEAEVAVLRKQLPKGLEGSMIQRELPAPRETRTMPGGDYLAKGEPVQPGVPAFLHPLQKTSARANRLDLARWMVDPRNPLLARVVVNRIWQEYFGAGLVATENDFGTQGTPPTHAELLDWLATELVRSGWSQKAVHRAIVNSAVYRQSSKVKPNVMERDPRNQLLSRQTRLRLDSEIVRDVALSASGLLTTRVGGPSVFPPQPEAAMSASQIKKTWKASTGADRYRRGMYTFFWRVTPNPALVVFDAPNAMVACTRRNRSNTPLQALTLLNDTAFHEFAQATGARLVREAQGDAARLDRAYELALSRKPSAPERERLQRWLAQERDALASKPEEAKALAADLEVALWTSLARVLLNTDEFITRE